MKPTLGRIVHYSLSPADVEEINAARSEYDPVSRSHLPPQDSRGDAPSCGDVVPMIITKVTPAAGVLPEVVNGQAILDGSDSLWIKGAPASEKPEPGHWTWPPRD